MGGEPRSPDDEYAPSDDTLVENGFAYRWVCPICGASDDGFVPERDAPEIALDALQTHIRSAGGCGHGAPATIPLRWSVAQLQSCVRITYVL
ncbi:MAG: hypothetical protein ABEJ28_11275 [Salinigranum sp.]